MLVRGGTVVTSSGLLQADVAVEDGEVVAVAPGLDEQPARDRRARAAYLPRRRRPPRPLQRARSRRLGGDRDRQRGGRRGRRDLLRRHAPERASAHDRRRRLRREAAQRWSAARPATSRSGAGSSRAVSTGSRSWRRAARRLQGVHVPSGIDDFEAADDATLRAGMARAAALGLPVAVHAERGPPPAAARCDRLAATGRDSAARSRRSSKRSSARSLSPRRRGARSTSSMSRAARGVRLVVEARARGVDATCETCPHYLLFDEDDAKRSARSASARRRCGRPSAAELWAELLGGAVDLVGERPLSRAAVDEAGRRLRSPLGRHLRLPDAPARAALGRAARPRGGRAPRPQRRRPSGSASRARAGSSRAPTPTSRSSNSTRSGR